MKHLILMRHASAEPGEPDRERPLSARGREEARRMAGALGGLAERGFRPERALVSPARRTRETFEALCAGLGLASGREEDEALYLGSPGELLGCLERVPDAHAQLLVLGHNPGLSELAQWLVGSGEAEALRRAARGLVPAASAALRIPARRWCDLEPGCAELVELLLP